MLGWEVIVYRRGKAEPENTIAYWNRGSDALDLFQRLAKCGLARDHGGSGYPWIFTLSSGVFLPLAATELYGRNEQIFLESGFKAPPGWKSDMYLRN